MITMQGKYQTRDGRAVRILATDVKANSYSVVGIVTEYAGGREFISEWTATGESISRMYGTHNDLIPVPTKHEGWCLVDTQAPSYTSRAEAERAFDAGNYAEGFTSNPRYVIAYYAWEE